MILNHNLCPRRSVHSEFNILTGEFEDFDYSNPKICHGGGKGGGGTNTVTSTASPPQSVLNNYNAITSQANNVAGQPLQQYGGPTVAGFTPDQLSAFGTIDQSQGVANPFINSAAQLIGQGTQPLWNGVQQFSPSAVQQYQSPYTQNVLNTTMAAEQNQDAQQQAALQGNTISSGAFGGDRAGVASAILSGQQATANNATNANIENTGYSNALGEFNTQQQAQLGANEANSYLAQQGAFGLGNLGSEAQNTALTGASAQLQSGALQQQLGQEALNVPYENFLQQQAYPFQTTSWLSGIDEALGSGEGGTSSTTSPGGSSASQIAGLGLGGLGLLGQSGAFTGATGSAADTGWLSSLFSSGAAAAKRGGAIKGYDNGGSVNVPTDVPDVSISYVPQAPVSSHKGIGIPGMPKAYQAPQDNTMGQVSGLLKSLGGTGGSTPTTGAISSPIAASTWQAGADEGLPFGTIAPAAAQASNDANFLGPLENSGFGSFSGPGGQNRGGRIQKRAFGGEVLPDVLSGVGDIVGAFFGDPLAGSQATGLLSDVDGGKTDSGLQLARGGNAHYDVGGVTPTTASLSGQQMNTVGSTLNNMTPQQLQNYLLRLPIGSQQAQQVQSLLQQKRMLPNTGAQVQGGMGSQPGVMGTQQPPQQAQPAMAKRGGVQGYATDGSVPPDTDQISNIEDLNNQLDQESSGTTTVPQLSASALGSGAPSTSSVPAMGGMGTKQPAPSEAPAMNSRAPASANPWLALAEAGFATAAGNSPHALQNIGAGAMAGIQNYGKQQQEADTVNEAADKLMSEAQQHKNALAVEQQNADTNAARAKNEAAYQTGSLANMAAERQKPIPDGFGGFLIPNPQDPTKPSRIAGPLGDLNGSGTDASGNPTQSIANVRNVPKDPVTGQPLTGDAYLSTLPPGVAKWTKDFGDNNVEATPYLMAKGDPEIKAAIMAAPNYKPGWNEGTFKNYNRWAFDQNGSVVAKSLDTVIPHVQLLHDLTAAMNTGDVAIANQLQNKLATEYGVSLPDGNNVASASNLEAAQQLVGNEIVRSTIGQRGALGDREEVAKNLNNAANPQILQSNIEKVYMPALRAQANAAEQYYKDATHLNDFRDKLLPQTVSAIWGNKGQSQSGQPSIQQPNTPSSASQLPPPEQRVKGQPYTNQYGVTKTWTGTGWQ